MRNVTICYIIKSQHIEITMDASGALVCLKINGKDVTGNGDSMEHAVMAILEAGHNLQKDISEAFDWKFAGEPA